MPGVKCIDISHWQGFPDFEEVRASGVLAMIHKASEGTSYIDPNCTTNFVEATNAGISCCTYHWLSPSDPVGQMNFYLGVVDPVPGERMVIDYEQDGCSLAELHDAVRILKADPRQLQVTVSSGHLLKEQLGADHDQYLAENTDLWLAHYTSGNPTWSHGTYDHWTLWQYSDTGTLPGIEDAHVDFNEFNGSDKELLDWIRPAGAALPPSASLPLPSLETVYINVLAPEHVKVKMRVSTPGRSARRPQRRQDL